MAPLPDASLAKIKTSAPQIPNANPVNLKNPILSFKIQAAIKTIKMGVISNSKAANGLQQLKDDMRQELAQGLNNNGFLELDAGVLLDDIFYNNGKNFMLKRLREMKG